MLDFPTENWPAEDLARLRGSYEPLAESVRDLVDATIRTEADAETVAAVKADIDRAVSRLRERQIDGAFGARHTTAGETVAWGNAVVGIRNALAPPVRTRRDESGRVWADFQLGAAYEGPPGHVHGGVSALILDHVQSWLSSPISICTQSNPVDSPGKVVMSPVPGRPSPIASDHQRLTAGGAQCRGAVPGCGTG